MFNGMFNLVITKKSCAPLQLIKNIKFCILQNPENFLFAKMIHLICSNLITSHRHC